MESTEARKLEEVHAIPSGATTTDLPPGVLYRVSFKASLPLQACRNFCRLEVFRGEFFRPLACSIEQCQFAFTEYG